MEAKHRKNQQLMRFVKQNDMDVIGLSECNLNWKHIQPADRLEERTIGWFESLHISTAYYATYNTVQPYQFGGVSLWSVNQAAHRVMSKGVDTTGLGRWSWTRYRGRNGITLRVVSAYRPVLNKEGPTLVWNQQKTFWIKKGESECPRKLMTIHLCEAINSWQEMGDQIVLGIDTNESIKDESPTSFSTAMSEAGLIETILDQHGKNGPTTYRNGTKSIDGIYVSSTLRGCRCGYFPFQQPFDHRGIWIEIPFTTAFGHNIPPIVRAASRRLKTEDPRRVKSYQDKYIKLCNASDLFNRARQLAASFQVPLTRRNALEYEAIDELRMKALEKAEKQCCKIYTGEVPWSPPYRKAQDKLRYWKKVKKRLAGRWVSNSYLKRLAHSAKVEFDLSVSPAYVEECIAAAAKNKKKEKKDAFRKQGTSYSIFGRG